MQASHFMEANEENKPAYTDYGAGTYADQSSGIYADKLTMPDVTEPLFEEASPI